MSSSTTHLLILVINYHIVFRSKHLKKVAYFVKKKQIIPILDIDLYKIPIGTWALIMMVSLLRELTNSQKMIQWIQLNKKDVIISLRKQRYLLTRLAWSSIRVLSECLSSYLWSDALYIRPNSTHID